MASRMTKRLTRTDLEDFKNNVQRFLADANFTVLENESLTKTCDADRAELHAISKDRDNYREKYQELEKQLEDIEKKHANSDATLRDQMDILEGTLARVRTERNEARNTREANAERSYDRQRNEKKLKELEEDLICSKEREDSLRRQVATLNIKLDQVTKAEDKRIKSSPRGTTYPEATAVVTNVRGILDHASKDVEGLRPHVQSCEVSRGTEEQNELASKCRRLQQKLKNTLDELKRCREKEKSPQKDSYITKQYEETIKSYEEALKQQTGYKEMIQLQASKINKLMEEITQLTKALHNSEKELDDTRNRLSEQMGTNLTDNNPNIADLSDQNRPTKLGERYSQLYDTPWTEAYEALEHYIEEEQDIIVVLRDILVKAHAYCENKANDQMQQLQEVFFRPEAKRGGNIDHVRKQLKDLRKASVEKTAKEHFKSYWSDMSKQTSNHAQLSLCVKSYVEDCFTLCWMMAVQDPPVVLGSIPKRGDTFDKTLFREYTQSGPMVEFVVWPPLYLHSGGPILSKGIAQGYRSTRSPGAQKTARKDDGYPVNAQRPTTEGGGEDSRRRGRATAHSAGERNNDRAERSGYNRHSPNDKYEHDSRSSRDNRSPGERQYDRGYSRPSSVDRLGIRSPQYNETYLSGTKPAKYTYSAQRTTTKLAGKSSSELPGIASQNVMSPSRHEMQLFDRYCKEHGKKYARLMLGEEMYIACLNKCVSSEKY